VAYFTRDFNKELFTPCRQQLQLVKNHFREKIQAVTIIILHINLEVKA